MTFITYPKLHMIGKEETKDIFTNQEDLIVIQEKIDGANFRFMINEEGNIIFGSRTQLLVADEEHRFQKNFNRCIQYIKQKLQNETLDNYKGLIFYGECCVKHTMNYDWEKIPPFLGFDVYHVEQMKFLDYDTVKFIFDSLGLTMVPHITTVAAREITTINDNIVPTSQYSSLHKAEGVVFKNYTKGIFAKYVRDEFKEQNAEVFGGTPKIGLGEESNFVARYCTNARIDKQIFKLIDEGEKLDLPLMKILPNRVWDDLWDENYREISRLRSPINFHECKKMVTRRCLWVLRQVITNNALQTYEKTEVTV